MFLLICLDVVIVLPLLLVLHALVVFEWDEGLDSLDELRPHHLFLHLEHGGFHEGSPAQWVLLVVGALGDDFCV